MTRKRLLALCLATLFLASLWIALPSHTSIQWDCDRKLVLLREDELAGEEGVKKVYATHGYEIVKEVVLPRGRRLVFQKCAHGIRIK